LFWLPAFVFHSIIVVSLTCTYVSFSNFYRSVNLPSLLSVPPLGGGGGKLPKSSCFAKNKICTLQYSLLTGSYKFKQMSNRRSFLHKMGVLSASALTVNLLQPAWSRDLHTALDNAASIAPSDLASDEDFWHYVQQSYTIAPNFINLNNGGVAPAPKPVADAMKTNYDISNQAPSYFM